MKKVIIDTEEIDTIKVKDIDLQNSCLIARHKLSAGHSYWCRLTPVGRVYGYEFSWVRITDGDCEIVRHPATNKTIDSIEKAMNDDEIKEAFVFHTINEAMRYALEHDTK